MIALDTNILVYAEHLQRAPDDTEKMARVDAIMPSVRREGLVLAAQVLAELCNVLRRRKGLSVLASAAVILNWRNTAIVVQPTTMEVIESSLAIATRHGFQTFDCIILAAAAQAGCPWLLSEDIPAGTTHGPCQVANPFLPWPPGLTAALA